MKITFLGAAQTVTGSCYKVETDKVTFSIDCGMHQGNAAIETRNRDTSHNTFEKLKFILLTHAHMDHSGLLPRAVKEGFNGTIYCTEATKALLEIMLLDSAHIQESDAEWESRKRARKNLPPVQPLYTQEDAIATMKLVQTVTYDRMVELPGEGIRFVFRNAGHILGSAIVEVEVTEKTAITRVVFSGDLGRSEGLLMEEPETPQWKPDYVFMESTYGDRNHKSNENSLDELAEAINYSYKHGEKTIIPAFAIERTQKLILILKQLIEAKKIPASIPIYIDSPLAIRATKIYRTYIEYLDRTTTDMFLEHNDPFDLPNITYTLEGKESQELNTLAGPAIIISASGMCNAGRIRHHLRHNLWRKGASVVFTGYQAVGTPGRRIIDGAKSITMLGEELVVGAKIYTIGGFSAHAGQDQLVSWVKSFATEGTQVFLVHGEANAITTLAGRLESETSVKTYVPQYLEEITIANTNPIESYIPVQQTLNWDDIIYASRVGVEQLAKNISIISERDPAIQTEIYDKMVELGQRIKSLAKDL